MGSKAYPKAEVVDTLPSVLDNTSSLFYWQGELWTVNDHGGLVMYSLDTLSAQVLRRLPAEDTLPLFSDMEETAQDSSYFYFGDFGNNHEQPRNDLRVLRLSKADLLEGVFRFDTIFFTYEGYTDISGHRKSLPTTDYDCEAMIVDGDSLYLFTKQWTSFNTECFALPNTPGRHTARSRGRLEVEGLVTGACYLPQHRLLVLSCYSIFCQPFVYLLYGFQGTGFFEGEGRRLPLDNPIGTQTEAIASIDGLHYYLTNENLSRSGITCPPQLLKLDLTDYLGHYLGSDTTHVGANVTDVGNQIFKVSPNPVSDRLSITGSRMCAGEEYVATLYDISGKEVMSFPVTHPDCQIVDMGKLSSGAYLLCLTLKGSQLECHTIVKK